MQFIQFAILKEGVKKPALIQQPGNPPVMFVTHAVRDIEFAETGSQWVELGFAVRPTHLGMLWVSTSPALFAKGAQVLSGPVLTKPGEELKVMVWARSGVSIKAGEQVALFSLQNLGFLSLQEVEDAAYPRQI